MKLIHTYIGLLLLACSTNSYAGDLLSKATMDDGLSVFSEKLLVNAIDNINSNNISAAISDLRQLTQLNPDFKAAQLVYADMLLAKAQGITDFGNVNHVAYEKINALREEVLARWHYQDISINKADIPASLIQLNQKQDHIVVVDTSVSRLYLFSNQEGIPQLISDHYVTIGKKGTGKYVEGDQKTPVGVYFVTGFIDPEELPDLYGDGAFPINYPNVWDRRHGRTGYGIWLHGTPSRTFSRPPLDSNGCVIVSNEDLNILAPYMHHGETPVIITEKIDWISRQEWTQKQQGYAKFIEQWRQDWESKNADKYLSHYSKDYAGLGKDYHSWVAYKKRVNPSKKFIKVDISNKSMFMYPGDDSLLVVTFVQDYKSDNFQRRFTKRQYWQKEADGKWRIIYEGAAS